MCQLNQDPGAHDSKAPKCDAWCSTMGKEIDPEKERERRLLREESVTPSD